jgi:hypothetical protein
MRTRSVKVSWVFLAAVLVLAGSASVVRADEELVVAHVPFAFIAGDSRLPAGDYIVKEMEGDPSVIAIASADGRRSVFMLTIASPSIETQTQAQLVFDKVGSLYFLARVMPDGGNQREIVLTPARMEHELAATALNP